MTERIVRHWSQIGKLFLRHLSQIYSAEPEGQLLANGFDQHGLEPHQQLRRYQLRRQRPMRSRLRMDLGGIKQHHFTISSTNQ